MDIPPTPRRARHDGWTPDRQQRFVAALAEYGQVATAVKLVGMTKQSLYRFRRHPDAAGFCAAWDAALAGHHHRAKLAAMAKWTWRASSRQTRKVRQVGQL
ncbi:MAG: LysR family transcriptional regulator [Sandarakinorhabdus sp.]|nr:LysR family transcriptional regulator [Sandarakinorhabdus sp.]